MEKISITHYVLRVFKHVSHMAGIFLHRNHVAMKADNKRQKYY